MPDPFAVDEDKALETLVSAWESAGYDQIWHHEGSGWGAAHADAPDDDVIVADTPGELDAKIRQDWQRRTGPDPQSVAGKYLY